MISGRRDCWGGYWLLRLVRLGLWAQAGRAPTSEQGRGGPEEEKSGGAAQGKCQGRWSHKDKDRRLPEL